MHTQYSSVDCYCAAVIRTRANQGHACTFAREAPSNSPASISCDNWQSAYRAGESALSFASIAIGIFFHRRTRSSEVKSNIMSLRVCFTQVHGIPLDIKEILRPKRPDWTVFVRHVNNWRAEKVTGT